LEGLSAALLLPNVSAVLVHSDSAYVINTMKNKWWIGWIRDGWRTANGKKVKNQDLWLRLINVLNASAVKVEWIWIKGHAGHVWNEQADKLAKSAVPGGFKKHE
jgi:ribonuclease HI